MAADAGLYSSSQELFKSSENPFEPSSSVRGFSFNRRPVPLTLPMTQFSLRLPRDCAFLTKLCIAPCIQTQGAPASRRNFVHVFGSEAPPARDREREGPNYQ